MRKWPVFRCMFFYHYVHKHSTGCPFWHFP
jgi:hypothetical protein